jgi:hypothetical protein
MAFGSGDSVTINMMGQTVLGTYKLDGDNVDVTVGGQTHVLTMDSSGCLEGGINFGKLCKS